MAAYAHDAPGHEVAVEADSEILLEPTTVLLPPPSSESS